MRGRQAAATVGSAGSCGDISCVQGFAQPALMPVAGRSNLLPQAHRHQHASLSAATLAAQPAACDGCHSRPASPAGAAGRAQLPAGPTHPWDSQQGEAAAFGSVCACMRPRPRACMCPRPLLWQAAPADTAAFRPTRGRPSRSSSPLCAHCSSGCSAVLGSIR